MLRNILTAKEEAPIRAKAYRSLFTSGLIEAVAVDDGLFYDVGLAQVGLAVREGEALYLIFVA